MSSPFARLSKWFGNKPYTKAMYISAIASCVMAGMSAVMCWTLVQNHRSYELANRQILATLFPSVEMALSEPDDGKLTLTIRNVGLPDIEDLRLYPILYRFDSNNVLRDRKIKNGPSMTVRTLRSGESIAVKDWGHEGLGSLFSLANVAVLDSVEHTVRSRGVGVVGLFERICVG